MKKLLLGSLLSLICFNGHAQDPDPELFGTWYLYYYEESDLGSNWDISEMDPPITPYIIISEDLSFNGEGACNTFNGIYEFSETNVLTASSFNQTTNDCEPHNHFENSFFSTMQYYWYNINQDYDGLSLVISTPIFGYALFKNYPLSTTDFTLNEITIYPNPVFNTLNISSESSVINSVTIYSLTGKKIFEESKGLNSIDVSNLSKGMYFIEIFSESGKTVKKFIKK